MLIDRLKNTLGAIDYSVWTDWVTLQFDKTDKHLALKALDLFNTFAEFESVEYEEESGYHFVTGNLGGVK